MTKTTTNEDIVHLLKKASAVMEAQNANRFRIRAYQNAIDSIQNLDVELSLYSRQDELDQISGIGKELAAKIREILETGQSQELTQLFGTVPQGMFPLLDVPGIGPKRALLLSETFHLDDPKTALSELKNVAEKHQIQTLEGFGEKSEKQILDNLNRAKPKSSRMRLDQGDVIATQVKHILESIAGVERVEVLGSLRRRKDTVGDIDVAVATQDQDKVLAELQQHPNVVGIDAAGENVIRLRLANNKQVDVKFQVPEKFGATLQHFTGSKFHNIALRELALSQGKSLSEHGIKQAGKLIPFKDEADFYQFLGLDYIPPTLRENEGEIEAAKNHQLPPLIQQDQIHGDFHTHTDFSWASSHDYGEEVGRLLSQAAEQGYEWLALGDHSPSRSTYSDQEMVKQVKMRNKYIQEKISLWQKANMNTHITPFSALEVDIQPDGTLSMPVEATSLLDFAIASIHSVFNLSATKQTRRILKALDHPKVKVLGHPTGRLILKRPAIAADWELVYKKCAHKKIALEINASPHRLDFPDSLIKEARKHGVSFAIGTDAHQASQMQLMPYGITVAQRGWLEKQDVMNTYSTKQLNAWLNA